MSEIQVKLTIHTNNKVSKKSLARKKPKLHTNSRYLKVKDLIFDLLEKNNFMSIENSNSSRAYDGWGFDLEKRAFDFFWYFPDRPFGRFKASYLMKQLFCIEPKFKELGLEFDISITFGKSTSSS